MMIRFLVFHLALVHGLAPMPQGGLGFFPDPGESCFENWKCGDPDPNKPDFDCGMQAGALCCCRSKGYMCTKDSCS